MYGSYGSSWLAIAILGLRVELRLTMMDGLMQDLQGQVGGSDGEVACLFAPFTAAQGQEIDSRLRMQAERTARRSKMTLLEVEVERTV